MGEIVRFKVKTEYKYKKTTVIIALAAVTVLILFIINSITPIFKTTGKQKQTSVILNSTTFLMGKTTDNAIVCNNDEIIGIAKNGEQAWKIALKFDSPVMKNRGKYTFVADAGNFESKLILNGKEKLAHTSDGEISAIAVNKSGYYAIASREKGFRTRISVYDNKGKNVYAWHTADYDVIDIALSADNNKMAVSAVGSNGGKSLSTVFLFSFGSQEYKTCYQGDENFVAGVYFAGRNIICIGDTAVYSFAPSSSKIWEINYNGRTLQEFAYDESSVLAMGFTRSSLDSLIGGSVVEIYNAGGRLKGSYETKNVINSIDVSGRDIFINTEEKSVIVNDRGNIASNLPITHNSRDSVLLPGGVFLPSGNSVELYSY